MKVIAEVRCRRRPSSYLFHFHNLPCAGAKATQLDTTPGTPTLLPDQSNQTFAGIENITRKLEEMQIRMSLVVCDRHGMQRLIYEIDASAPRSYTTTEPLRTVLAAARRHLQLSEEYEDEEERISRFTPPSRRAELLQPLLARVYQSWLAWQTAHTACMHQITHARYSALRSE